MRANSESANVSKQVNLPNEETMAFFLKLWKYFDLFKTRDLDYKNWKKETLYNTPSAVKSIWLLAEYFCNTATNSEKEEFKQNIEKLKNTPEKAYLYLWKETIRVRNKGNNNDYHKRTQEIRQKKVENKDGILPQQLPMIPYDKGFMPSWMPKDQGEVPIHILIELEVEKRNNIKKESNKITQKIQDHIQPTKNSDAEINDLKSEL